MTGLLKGEQCEAKNCEARGFHVVITGTQVLWLCRRCMEYVRSLADDDPPPRRRPRRRWNR